MEERRDALAVTAQLGVLLGKLHADLFGVVGVEGKAVHLLHGGLSGGDADEEHEAHGHAVLVVHAQNVTKECEAGSGCKVLREVESGRRGETARW